MKMMIEHFRNFGSACNSIYVPDSGEGFTSLPGGDMVDGLPPASSLDPKNFRPKHNFSILILRFLERGKFILALIIFPPFFAYVSRFW